MVSSKDAAGLTETLAMRKGKDGAILTSSLIGYISVEHLMKNR